MINHRYVNAVSREQLVEQPNAQENLKLVEWIVVPNHCCLILLVAVLPGGDTFRIDKTPLSSPSYSLRLGSYST